MAAFSRSGRAALPDVVAGVPVPSLAPMLERITPSVVNINTRTHVRVRDPFFDDPVFRRFFGGPSQPRERVQQSLGSGVIVDAAKGYVLTNNHVIDGADDVSVTLTDGRTLAGKVIGSDPDTDLAVVQIPAERLSAMPLGDVARLRVGDFVVAVGNPFGLGQTVTSGIVSGLDRTRVGGERGGYQNFIQTDASINPGNSGGPLVDLNGRLIGINSMIFSPSGGNIGIGFAIPIDLAKRVMDQLVQFGEVRRGALGVETQDINDELAGMLGLGANARGAVVTRVRAGGSADNAGIRVGDAIVSFDGKPVVGAQELHNMEGLAPIGASVTLGVVRDGKPINIVASLKAPVVPSVAGQALDTRLSGSQFSDPNPDRRGRNVVGAVASRVDAGSRIHTLGLRAGDVVVAVNQRRIGGIDDFQQLARRIAGNQMLLTVARGQNLFYVVVE